MSDKNREEGVDRLRVRVYFPDRVRYVDAEYLLDKTYRDLFDVRRYVLTPKPITGYRFVENTDGSWMAFIDV